MLNLSRGWQVVLFPFMIAWVGDNIWMVYVAFVLLAIPFCILSIRIERTIALRSLPDLKPAEVGQWIRDANVWSYVLLVAVGAAYPLYMLNHAP